MTRARRAVGRALATSMAVALATLVAPRRARAEEAPPSPSRTRSSTCPGAQRADRRRDGRDRRRQGAGRGRERRRAAGRPGHRRARKDRHAGVHRRRHRRGRDRDRPRARLERHRRRAACSCPPCAWSTGITLARRSFRSRAPAASRPWSSRRARACSPGRAPSWTSPAIRRPRPSCARRSRSTRAPTRTRSRRWAREAASG